VAPEDIDVYDPARLTGHVCFNPQVKEALKKVCDWGFEDLFRKYHKEGGHYTFWDYRERGAFSRNLGWRLDHIMATEVLAKKCKGCYIDAKPREGERPSDHTPVVAEFDI
jgi:exodeoxyribonuclease-3